MKHLILPLAIFAQLIACSSSRVDTRCGDGEAVEADGRLACVYKSGLIEEGFVCPSLVPTGFLLEGGGVACIDGNMMPPPLKDELSKGGYEPSTPTCFDAVPEPGCFYQVTIPAYDPTNARTITYQAEGSGNPCIPEGSLYDFTFDTQTLSLTYGVAVMGDDAKLTRSEQTIVLTQTQADILIDLVAEIPDPMCVPEPNANCSPNCPSEELSVDSKTFDNDCCGRYHPEFQPNLSAVVDYVKTLLPVATVAFTNATDFGVLTYTTGPGFGYCVDEGMVLSATITRTAADNSLSIQGTTAVLGDAAVDTCIEGTTDDNCYVATAFGPMTVGAAEQNAIEAALDFVPAPMCVVDQGLACDPCRVTVIDLDGTRIDNNCCGDTAAGFGAAFAATVTAIEASR